MKTYEWCSECGRWHDRSDLPWVHFSMYWPDPEEPDERNLHGSDEDLAKARAAFRSQPTPAYVVTIEP
jgi:hypothetical protein